MLEPLVFSDLDDTLFQSRRKMPQGAVMHGVATAANGDPQKASFMTDRQRAIFAWLNATSEVIPVTARSAESFSRVALPFRSWAVLSNGAVILEPDGAVHSPWQARMKTALGHLGPMMDDILRQGMDAARTCNLDLRSWIVTEDGLSTYVVFKLNVVTPQALQALQTLPLPATGWTRHFNSETLAIIPPCSGKAGAVDYLCDLLNPTGDRPTLGFGDSLSDLSFMRRTDILLVPSPSQIAASL